MPELATAGTRGGTAARRALSADVSHSAAAFHPTFGGHQPPMMSPTGQWRHVASECEYRRPQPGARQRDSTGRLTDTTSQQRPRSMVERRFLTTNEGSVAET
jgi:hypothetical protein